METILIATDFSPAALNAATYGVELAKSMHAKVVLFTAYQPVLALPDSALYISAEELKKSSDSLLKAQANAIDPLKTLQLETQSWQGPVNSSIIEAASENKASYIVVGMKDRGKEIRRYFGSTVTHLCKTSAIPLIVVPANAVFSEPQRIALASDITAGSDLHLIDPLKRIAENFDSHLFIVRVVKKALDEVEEQAFRSDSLSFYLSNVAHYYKFIEDENVAHAMNGFVKEYRVSMVAVMPHEHSLFERIFSRSVTKDLVFNCRVPILVLPASNAATKAETEATVGENDDVTWSID